MTSHRTRHAGRQAAGWNAWQAVGWNAVRGAAVVLALVGLVGFQAQRAAAQERTLKADGSPSQGLTGDDARASAVGNARIALGKQAAAVIGALAQVKAVNPSAEAVTALARTTLPVTIQDAGGGSVTAQTTYDLATLEAISRKLLVDEDLMQRLQEASAGFQAATSAAPSPASAKLIGAYHEYLNGLALWLGGGSQSLTPAVEAFTRAVTLAPDSAPAWTARGLVRIGLSQLDLGIEDLNKGVALDAKSDEALRARAVGYMARLQYALAETDLNQAIKLDPKDAASRNARGELYAQLKRTDKALQEFDEAIRLAPNYAVAHYNKGALLGTQQRMETALREYDAALKLDPALTLALNNRGNLLARLKEYDKALKDLDKAVLLDPELAAAFNNRGEVHRAQGQNEKAIQDFDEAIKLRPTYANAYINRAAALQAENKVDLAFRDLEFAAKLIPPNATLYAYRGSAYARLSLPAKACQEWKKACELGEKSVCEFLKKPDVCEAELPE